MKKSNIFYLYYLRRLDKIDPFDLDKGQPFYVGKGSNGRHSEHRKEAEKLRHKSGRKSYKINIIHKLWKQGLDFQEDIVLSDLSQQDALDLEIAAIEQYGRIDLGTGCLANLTDGGEGLSGLIRTKKHRENMSKALMGHFVSTETRRKKSKAISGPKHFRFGKHLSEDHKKKISEDHTGKPRSEETKEKLSKANTGKTHTPETKEKIRQKALGRPKSAETIEKLSKANPNKSHPHTEETKQKLREKAIGRVNSKETRLKLSKALKGRIITEEWKENISKARRGQPWSENRRKKHEEKKKEKGKVNL